MKLDFSILNNDEIFSDIEKIITKLYIIANKFSDRIVESFIIHPKNLSIREDGIICIPAYMTFCL